MCSKKKKHSEFSLQDSSPITKQVLDTIQQNSVKDPVAAQYLKSEQENIISLQEKTDPIGDDIHSPVKGLVHRYPDRVLLKITDVCSVYCRFCFRKEMIAKGQGILKTQELEKALSYIKENRQIHEVILSGGDPLTLSNRRFAELLKKLEEIDHLDVIRIHTRQVMVKPDRIDQDFIQTLRQSSKAVYIVIHVNHAQEINENVLRAFSTLSNSGAVLLSQTVLLKNINNSAKTLAALFKKLIKHSIKPYYLHHLDLAKGTNHFRVSIEEGQKIMKELQGQISGIALPTYVLDIPGGYGKVPVQNSSIETISTNSYLIEDRHGCKHVYKDDIL